MKKRTCIIIAVILVVLILSVVLFTKCRKDALFAEEIQKLREEHPQYFDLDTSEGLNVLVFRNGTNGVWIIRLVPGNKDYFSILEGVQFGLYDAMLVEEAKMVLQYYDLPDEMVILRPYDDPIVSSHTLAMFMREENFLIEMAEAFDNRYQIGEIFELVYVPEIDGVLAQQGATGG